MNLPRLLREALHRRYCCECSAWENLALEGLANEEPSESMVTWKAVETPAGIAQVAEMNVVTAIAVVDEEPMEYTLPWVEPPPEGYVWGPLPRFNMEGEL